MSKKAYDMIAEGLTEAIAIARGDAKPARLFVPPEIDVKAIRLKLSLSQDDFANAFGFTVSQIRQWEQGRNRPLQAHRAYLMVIETNPKQVLRTLGKVREEAKREADRVAAEQSERKIACFGGR